MRLFNLLLVLIAAVFTGGCASNILHFDKLDKPIGQRSVLLMPVNVHFMVGDTPIVDLEWLNGAQPNVSSVMENFTAAQGANLIMFEPQSIDVKFDSEITRIQKMHAEISEKMLDDKDRVDWTFGPAIAVLRKRHKVDYVLFVKLKEIRVFIGKIWGIAIQGHAALADAGSGDIIWADVSHRQGSLLSLADTQKMAEQILGKFPK